MTDDVTDYMQLDAVNISTLIHMLDGPKAYAHAISAGFDDSPAMAQGRALHCLVLEPDQFERRYVVSPYADLRSDAAKAWPDLFRLAVFEPVELTRRVVVSPYADYRTKAAQAWKADQLAANMTIIRD